MNSLWSIRLTKHLKITSILDDRVPMDTQLIRNLTVTETSFDSVDNLLQYAGIEGFAAHGGFVIGEDCFKTPNLSFTIAYLGDYMRFMALPSGYCTFIWQLLWGLQKSRGFVARAGLHTVF